MKLQKKVEIKADAPTVLNTIRANMSPAFRDAVPMVQTASDVRAFGTAVLGSGQWQNEFTGLLGQYAAQYVSVRSYDDILRKFNKGMLEVGESVENIYVNLVKPEGYTADVASPGDVFKTNKPDVRFVFHPVNRKTLYRITLNQDEISQAFASVNGVTDLVARIIGRLEDSANLDEFVLTKWMLARAYLDNEAAVKVGLPALNKTSADDALIAIKEASANMTAMDSSANIAGVPSSTPVEDQHIIMSNHASAILQVGSLAHAFQLSEAEYRNNYIAVNSFKFNDVEKERLTALMNEAKEQGLIADYTPFTAAEEAKLAKIAGVVFDVDFLMIFDRLHKATTQFDAAHLNTNQFLHVWQVISYNPFVNVRYFVEA